MLRRYSGLLPPFMTSVGTLMFQRSAGSDEPRPSSPRMRRSHGSVWATSFSFFHTGVSFMIARPKPGTPTIFMNFESIPERSPRASMSFICSTMSAGRGV
ncbi:hypothetical protein UK23_25350 [Lentzea aerocolonigenes]|uniref:Uncharacterized protein n=1 Tax=Lentzea aerocolonigenes TaxID=68170 RepID=A0A0F0GST6_LENAE|nr:hypothetical protein UK23_25350 [Lentzea aerocolonigenes]